MSKNNWKGEILSEQEIAQLKEKLKKRLKVISSLPPEAKTSLNITNLDIKEEMAFHILAGTYEKEIFDTLEGLNRINPNWKNLQHDKIFPKITPLMVSLYNGNYIYAKKLLDLGADVSKKDAKDKNTLYHLAASIDNAQYRHPEIIDQYNLEDLLFSNFGNSQTTEDDALLIFQEIYSKHDWANEMNNMEKIEFLSMLKYKNKDKIIDFIKNHTTFTDSIDKSSTRNRISILGKLLNEEIEMPPTEFIAQYLYENHLKTVEKNTALKILTEEGSLDQAIEMTRSIIVKHTNPNIGEDVVQEALDTILTIIPYLRKAEAKINQEIETYEEGKTPPSSATPPQPSATKKEFLNFKEDPKIEQQKDRILDTLIILNNRPIKKYEKLSKDELMIFHDILGMVSTSNFKILQSIAQKYPELINRKKQEETPLHAAIKVGNFPYALELLEIGADITKKYKNENILFSFFYSNQIPYRSLEESSLEYNQIQKYLSSYFPESKTIEDDEKFLFKEIYKRHDWANEMSNQEKYHLVRILHTNNKHHLVEFLNTETNFFEQSQQTPPPSPSPSQTSKRLSKQPAKTTIYL